MTYTKRFFLAAILIASIALTLAYTIELIWLGAFTAIGLGFLGWFGQNKQEMPWINDLFLAGVVIQAIIGTLLGLRPYLLLPAVIGVLAAWDLARFQQRLADAPISDSVRKIEKRHLSLLALALMSGGIFSGVVLTTRIHISFGIALVLGVILIISLGQVYRLLAN
jgi:hypothetical protein